MDRQELQAHPSVLPANYAEALRLLRRPEFVASPAHFVQLHRANRVGVHPDILEFDRRFHRRFARLGVPMFAHNMMRTSAEQDALYVQGVTKARGKKSPHNFGMAVDLVHGTRAWDVPPASWSVIGHIGKEIAAQQGVALTWGGDWKFYDPAHWELANWKQLVNDGYKAPVVERTFATFDDFYRTPE